MDFLKSARRVAQETLVPECILDSPGWTRSWHDLSTAILPKPCNNNIPRSVWRKSTGQLPIVLRIQMRCTPTSNGKTSCGKQGVPRVRPGQAPSLRVCGHCGHQRLPSAHESQDRDLVSSQDNSRLALHDLHTSHALGRSIRTN
jgi:hypothetical protein